MLKEQHFLASSQVEEILRKICGCNDEQIIAEHERQKADKAAEKARIKAEKAKAREDARAAEEARVKEEIKAREEANAVA